MPAGNGNQNLAQAVTEVSERVTVLVREEIELAKAETMEKVNSLARGALAIGIGVVLALYAMTVALATLAWGLNAIIVPNSGGDIWVGFAITFGIMLVLILVAVLIAWRKLRVGAPTPTMAIDEAKKIRETVTAKTEM